MTLCNSCRMAIRHSSRQTRQMSTKPTPADILSKPSWSVRSLLSSDMPDETITSKQLHHLLRLSALPLPKSPEEETTMITTLQSQLRFVRAVQRVDTTGVEPLRAIRDESDAGIKEVTLGLKAEVSALEEDKTRYPWKTLKDVLDKEVKVGHYKRPRRVKEKLYPLEEPWDALGTASRRAGSFFVVKTKKGTGEGGG